MNYKKLSQEERDSILKNELPDEIVKIIERYRLISTPELKWISMKENSHEHIIFTQKFLLSSDEIGALFRANYLCFAKVAYFRAHIGEYEPMKYDPDQGFIKVPFSDSDFLMHKSSGKIIDYRFLQRITDIEVFKAFCESLSNKST